MDESSWPRSRIIVDSTIPYRWRPMVLELAQHVAVEVVERGRAAQAATQLSNNDRTDLGDRRGVRMGTWIRQAPHG